MCTYVVKDGCKTAVANELRGEKPWDPDFNMPVKVVWAPKQDRRSVITDSHFEPADCQKQGLNDLGERANQGALFARL